MKMYKTTVHFKVNSKNTSLTQGQHPCPTNDGIQVTSFGGPGFLMLRRQGTCLCMCFTAPLVVRTTQCRRAVALVTEMGNLSSTQVECSGGKKAVVVFVPVPQLKAFQKIQTRLVSLAAPHLTQVQLPSPKRTSPHPSSSPLNQAHFTSPQLT